MRDCYQPIADLVALNARPRLQPVAQRIERRLDVLREWLRDGIPMGKSVPESLNAARLWEDDDLGIQPIKTPNEFTTTHFDHGKDIRDIQGLLTALRVRYGRPKRPSSRASAVAKFDRKAFDRALEASVSQWQTERHQRLQEKTRADSAEARSYLFLAEIDQKDRLIADLRQQLSAQKGLRIVG